jgi:hypothetical protein
MQLFYLEEQRGYHLVINFLKRLKIVLTGFSSLESSKEEGIYLGQDSSPAGV